jgi:hypothetical protein
MPSHRLAIATSADHPSIQPDDAHLAASLERLGVLPVVCVWNDPAVDWSAFDAVLIRTIWDYFKHHAAFLDWLDRLDRLGIPTINDSALLRWNSDKRYLRDLDRAGVPIVPTTFVEPGEAVASALTEDEALDVIVKPAVSAGSNDTARYRAGERDAAQAHLARLKSEGRVAMVQPYQPAVDENGETALLYFDGRFSHAIRKGAIFAGGPQMVGGLFAREDIRAREPSAVERGVGDAALRAAAEVLPAETAPLLYARVDLVPLADGSPGVLELELCEPSVFVGHAEGGAERFAAAIARR